jgi:hypothetical protein
MIFQTNDKFQPLDDLGANKRGNVSKPRGGKKVGGKWIMFSLGQKRQNFELV